VDGWAKECEGVSGGVGRHETSGDGCWPRARARAARASRSEGHRHGGNRNANNAGTTGRLGTSDDWPRRRARLDP